MKKNLKYYMNLNYSIKLQKIDESDGETCYRFTIPKLPGMIAYGDTIDEGMKEMEGAKKAWFTSCLERNIKIPEPTKHHYSGKILLRMPKSLHAALDNIIAFVDNHKIKYE